MDVTLQKHGAKHIYKIPEGLRELCSDISREVLRSQPSNLYDFIANYVNALFITRENAKVAVKVVNNIFIGSEAILNILKRNGFNLEQILTTAPRIQKLFSLYLDAKDTNSNDDDLEAFEEESIKCIKNIFKESGCTLEQAEKTALIVQKAFERHSKKLINSKMTGKVLWQKAVANTLEILRKAGVAQEEAKKTAILIKTAYQGYYDRRNVPLIKRRSTKESEESIDPRETIQAVAWMDMMYEDSKFDTGSHESVVIIQKASGTSQEENENDMEESNTAALVIQEDEDEQPALIIQKPYRTRDEEEYEHDVEDHRAVSIIQKDEKEQPALITQKPHRTSGEEYENDLEESHRPAPVIQKPHKISEEEEYENDVKESHRAASVIQKAYRNYRKRGFERTESIQSTTVEDVFEEVFEKVIDIPEINENEEDKTSLTEMKEEKSHLHHV